LCGVEPTGLLGLFRFLWSNVDGTPNVANVSSIILKRLTVEWPDDERLKSQINERPIYGSSICNYVLLEYERALGADFPDGDPPWVEHILPQKPASNSRWRQDFTAEQHKQMVGIWANLLPLSAQMNSELSARDYSVKRDVYRQKSMYASARRVADTYNVWTPSEIADRSVQICKWAIKRWPRPKEA
jgi:hypothetical protein